MKNTLKHVIIFLIGTFVWTWACYFAIVISGLDPYQGTGMVLLICGGCSPTLVGLILAMATLKKGQRTEFLRRIYQVKRIKPTGWLFIVLLFPAVFAVSAGLDHALGGQLPGMTNLTGITANPLSFLPLVLLSFMSGPFSEEIGWRGFALDPLLRRLGFARASVLLGVIWGVWHLPLYFMPQTWHGSMGFQWTGFWLFVLMTVGLSGLMSFVYVKSQRSILSAMLMHLMSNFTAQLLAPVSIRTELFRGLLIFILGMGACAYTIKTSQDGPTNYAFRDVGGQ